MMINNKKLPILITLFFILISTIVSAETIGDTINGYTLTDYVIPNLGSSAENFNSASFICDNYVYMSRAGGKGWSIEQYNLDTHLVENYYWFFENQYRPSTDSELIASIDCDFNIMYTVVQSGVDAYLRSYYIPSFFGAHANLAPTTFNLIRDGLSSSKQLSSGSGIYSTDIRHFLGYSWLADYDSIFRFGIGDLATGTYLNLSETIYDITDDGEYLYALTNQTLYKIDRDLDIISQTSNTNIIPNQLPFRARTAKFIYYNSYKDKLYVMKNSTTLVEVNLPVLSKSKDINPSGGLTFYTYPSGSQKPLQFASKSFYKGEGTDVYLCSLDTSICEFQVDVTDWDEISSLFTANNNGYSKYQSGYLSNGKWSGVLYKNLVFSDYWYWGVISGFEKDLVFDDTVSVDKLIINKTPELVNTIVTATASAVHQEGSQYLQYAFSCSNNDNILSDFKVLSGTDLSNESKFQNNCNNEVDVNSYGTTDYIVKLVQCDLSGDLSQELGGLLYPFNEFTVLNNQLTIDFKIGQTEDQSLDIYLLSDEITLEEDITILNSVIGYRLTYDATLNKLLVYEEATNQLLFDFLLGYQAFPIEDLTKNLYNIKFMLDIPNKMGRIGVKTYGQDDYIYSDEFIIDNQITTFYFTLFNFVSSDGIRNGDYRVRDNRSLFFQINNTAGGPTLRHTDMQICADLRNSNLGAPITPIIEFIHWANTTTGLVETKSQSQAITSGVAQTYCGLISNNPKGEYIYPNNTVYNNEWYGVRCSNCLNVGAGSEIKMEVDDSVQPFLSYYSFNKIQSSFVPIGDNFMINVTVSRNFGVLVLNQSFYKIYGYLLEPLLSTGDKSELFGVKVTNEYLPEFNNNNTVQCIYPERGTYNLKVFITSIINPTYNKFLEATITILDYDVIDIGNAFDPLFELNDSPFSAEFWKFIMFLAFTLVIITGVGFFNGVTKFSEAGQINLEMAWIELLAAETFMLFIMAKYLNFFPLYYFILILVVDALTITGYIMKSIGNK